MDRKVVGVSGYLSGYLSIYLSELATRNIVYLSVCLSVCLYVSIYLSVCLSAWLAGCLCLSVYLSIRLSVCLAGWLSVSQSVYLSIRLSVYLSMCLSICLSVSGWLSVSLSVCLLICLSIYLSINLSVCKLENEAFVRDFLEMWELKAKNEVFLWDVFQLGSWQHQKRSNSAKLTPSVEVVNIRNEAILRDFLQKWKVECWADTLVPMRFAIFPSHLSQVLRRHEKVRPGHGKKCCACHAKSS